MLGDILERKIENSKNDEEEKKREAKRHEFIKKITEQIKNGKHCNSW